MALKLSCDEIVPSLIKQKREKSKLDSTNNQTKVLGSIPIKLDSAIVENIHFFVMLLFCYCFAVE